MKITYNLAEINNQHMSRREAMGLERAQALMSDLDADALDLKSLDGKEQDSLPGLPGEVLVDDCRNFINKMHARLSYDTGSGNVTGMEVKTTMPPPEEGLNVLRSTSSIKECRNEKGETLKEYHIHQWGTVGLSIPVPGFHNETVVLNQSTGTLTYIDRGINEGLLYM
jgi:hypothetical protein